MVFLHHGTRHFRSKQRPAYWIHTCSRSARGISALAGRGPGLGERVIYSLERRDHHKPQHGREEDDGVQQQADGCGRTHGVRNLKETTEDGLRELVGLGVGDDEEHQGRNKRILGLQSDVHSTEGGEQNPVWPQVLPVLLMLHPAQQQPT
jgi:hypothetical protein